MRNRIPATAAYVTDRARREAVLHRVERMTELPLLLLAFAMIPLLIGPIFWEMSPAEEATFFALNSFIWAAFAVDMGFKLVVAPDRFSYVRGHWLEILIVIIPFARPLWILRIVIFGTRAYRGIRRLGNVDFLLVYAIGLMVICASVVRTVEVDHNPNIQDFGDAMWWAIVTVTTVGYGDIVPQTIIGRTFSMVLMLTGIGLFGGITANLASVLVKTEDASEAQLQQLIREVRSLREEVTELRSNQEDS